MYNTGLVILPYIENYTEEFLNKLAADADYVICADGGQAIARETSITPDIVIGDFDSTKDEFRFPCSYITYPSEKDITDSEACLIHAEEAGVRNIIFAGGMGGRMDHTLGMLGTLLKFHDCFDSITMIDQKNQLQIFSEGTIHLPEDPSYRFFSLVPVFEKAAGITLKGCKYPIENYTLHKASTLGISNEVTSDYAEITVSEGPVYIIRSAD